DSRLQMNEMASTAVEFVPGSSVLAFALHEQAGRRLRLVEPAEVVSFRWTKASTWATVLAASVLVAPLLGFRPDTRGPAVSPERAVSIDSVLSLAEVARAA